MAHHTSRRRGSSLLVIRASCARPHSLEVIWTRVACRNKTATCPQQGRSKRQAGNMDEAGSPYTANNHALPPLCPRQAGLAQTTCRDPCLQAVHLMRSTSNARNAFPSQSCSFNINCIISCARETLRSSERFYFALERIKASTEFGWHRPQRPQ